MTGEVIDQEGVSTAEVAATLCLATDLAIGLPFGHGLHSTVVAMRLADLLGVDRDTAEQTYYGCLLFYLGCTADAEVSAELFEEGALLTHFTPVMFGSQAQTMAGILRALMGSTGAAPTRALRVVRKMPSALLGHRQHIAAMCQVGRMLSERLGVPPGVSQLFEDLTARWDGDGDASDLRGDQIPMAIRIIHVSRDAALHRLVGGDGTARQVIRARSGRALDPTVAGLFADHAAYLTDLADNSEWEATLACQPTPRRRLHGYAVDQALAAMGHFADLVCPAFAGHSSGVATLAEAAAGQCGLTAADRVAVRHASLVHDLGRVAVAANVWNKAGSLNADESERVRLHAYHSERLLSRSRYLVALTPIAAAHHERLDGSGYHRGSRAADLTTAARLVAAADFYCTKTEPRPHRPALTREEVARALGLEAHAGRLDGDSVASVLAAAGQPAPAVTRPAGLTRREAQVVGLLARGAQTKQVARALGVSPKTADHHVQNAYAKMGVSTRAGAAIFAMQHGLVPGGVNEEGSP